MNAILSRIFGNIHFNMFLYQKKLRIAFTEDLINLNKIILALYIAQEV